MPCICIHQHPQTSVPHASKHSTQQNPAPRPLQYVQASSNSTHRNSILSGNQHPHTPYKIPQVHSYRILQGEIGFFQIGSSITYHCNTTRSVCSNLFLCLELFYKKFNSIQDSKTSMQGYSTLSSIQIILVAILHKIH